MTTILTEFHRNIRLFEQAIIFCQKRIYYYMELEKDFKEIFQRKSTIIKNSEKIGFWTKVFDKIGPH